MELWKIKDSPGLFVLMMDSSNPTARGAKPRTNNRNNQQQRGNQTHRVVRKVPPRAATDRRNIYITSKTDFKVCVCVCVKSS